MNSEKTISIKHIEEVISNLDAAYRHAQQDPIVEMDIRTLHMIQLALARAGQELIAKAQ